MEEDISSDLDQTVDSLTYVVSLNLDDYEKYFIDGVNLIEVIAYNESGNLASNPYKVVYDTELLEDLIVEEEYSEIDPPPPVPTPEPDETTTEDFGEPEEDDEKASFDLFSEQPHLYGIVIGNSQL